MCSETGPRFEKCTFHKFYICFDVLKKGLLASCRKVLGLDGCFFKGRRAELLSGIGRDENHQMYPIAWDEADGEINETWD